MVIINATNRWTQVEHAVNVSGCIMEHYERTDTTLGIETTADVKRIK